MHYAIKVAIADPDARGFAFADQKTMYGRKAIREGDTIYLFDSETTGGAGLIARGTVTVATAIPPLPDVARQTPRVSIEVRRTASAKASLGRRELKVYAGTDGPEGELHFKLYRQATDKIVGISDETAAFLDGRF